MSPHLKAQVDEYRKRNAKLLSMLYPHGVSDEEIAKCLLRMRESHDERKAAKYTFSVVK